MPIEAGQQTIGIGETSVGAAYLAECRATLANALKKIENCLEQSNDADLWWRQLASHNSISTGSKHK